LTRARRVRRYVNMGRDVEYLHFGAPPPARLMPGLNAVQLYPICHRSVLLLHGRDGIQQRSWVTFSFGRLACRHCRDMSTSCVIPTNEHLVAPPPARLMPALHRFTAVYRCAIPPLHGRDGGQRRSWATFSFGRFACMTSSSASSVPSLPVRGHRFYSNQGLPARSF
jgi:hypothetical protein